MAHVVLSEEDKVVIKRWLARHNKKCSLLLREGPLKGLPCVGVLGARFTYEITPSNVGHLGKVICGCGKSVDLPAEGG